ncbi:MAG: polysaccharide biosynthesis protein [Clostridia bacterium]|nr:polysaccharide biosynthesis protein [Clostridia bacterium]
MNNHNFMRGAAVLAGAGLITKFIGALYRIPFARIVGEEGMGLYQMAYPIYTMILALSTAGIPVAISLLVAEGKAKNDYRGMNKILQVSLVLMFCLGLGSAWALYKSAHFLANNVLYDERAFYSLVVLAPAIFFAAVTSVFRGYFQGMMIMHPTGMSQVVEQVVRVATVFIAGLFLLKYGVEFAAAGATFGAVTGSLAALIFLALYYSWWRCRRQLLVGGKSQGSPSILAIVKRILVLAIPISLGGLVMPLMQVIDAAIVPLRLQSAGYDVAAATALFGQFSGMAVTLINLPTIVTISLAASLVPAISDAIARSNHQLVVVRLNEAIRLTVMLCLPAAAGFFLLAEEIGYLLYGLPEVGLSIRVLAPAALFLGLHQTTAGAIQGLGKTYLPVKHLVVGAAVKISLNYFLIAIPSLGIRGAGLATVISFFTAFMLNLRYLHRQTPFSFNFTYHLLKPGIAATIMAISIIYGSKLIIGLAGSEVRTIILIAGGIITYGIVLLLVGGIKKQDLEIIPGAGPGLAKILTKTGLIR